MAIDTAAKRASVAHMIIPDGTIAQADRQTIAQMYGGILATLSVTYEEITSIPVVWETLHALGVDWETTHSIPVKWEG